MNSRLRKVSSLDKQGDVQPVADPEGAGKGGEGAAAGGSANVEALVRDFLKELDSLAVDLSPPRVRAAPPPSAVKSAPEPEPAASLVIPQSVPPALAPEEDAVGGMDDAIADVDAELARTLDELESEEKSTVVTFPVPETAQAEEKEVALPSEPELQAAPPELPLTQPIPEPRAGQQDAPVESAPAAFMSPHPQARVFRSRARVPRRTRRIAALIAAAVLLGIIAVAVYLLSTSAAGRPGYAPGVTETPATAVPSPGAAGAPASQAVIPASTGGPQSLPPSAPSVIQPAGRTGASGNAGRAIPAVSRPPVRSAPASTAQMPDASAERASSSSSRDAAQGAGAVSNSPAVDRPVPPAVVEPKVAQSSGSAAPPGNEPAPRGVNPDPRPPVVDTNLPAPAPASASMSPAAAGLPAASVADNTQTPAVIPPSRPQAAGSIPPQSPAGTPISPMAQNETAADRSTAPPEARPVSAPIPGAAAAGAGGSAAAPGADPAGSLTTPAVAVSKPSPSYPALAKQQRVAGTVVVIGQVDEKGRVAKATAVSGPTLLRSAAEEAMLRWRFKPATRDGISIQSEVTVRFEFRY